MDLEILVENLENDVSRKKGYDWDGRDFHFGIFEKAVSRERNFYFAARLIEKGGHLLMFKNLPCTENHQRQT